MVFAPERPQVAPSNPDKKPDSGEDTTRPNWLKRNKGKVILGGSAVLLAGAGALGFTAANSQETPREEPVATAPADPSEAPAPVAPEPAPSETAEVPVEQGPTAVERLEAMSFDDFKTLDQQEHLIYIDALQRNEDPDQLYDQATELWNYNPANIASPDNNGQEIVMQYLYEQQLAVAIAAGDGSTDQLDKDAAKKALTGVYYYAGDEAVVTGAYNSTLEIIESNDTVVKLTNQYTATNTSELQQGQDWHGNPISYKDVDYFTASGESYKSRFAYVEFTTSEGERRGNWLLVETIGANEDPSELDTL